MSPVHTTSAKRYRSRYWQFLEKCHRNETMFPLHKNICQSELRLCYIRWISDRPPCSPTAERFDHIHYASCTIKLNIIPSHSMCHVQAVLVGEATALYDSFGKVWCSCHKCPVRTAPVEDLSASNSKALLSIPYGVETQTDRHIR